MEPTSGHWKKDPDFDSILEPLGLPRGLLGRPWWDLFSPLNPPGRPQGAQNQILRHLGRVLFSTLILDPQKRPKNSMSKAPEPRKLHSRLDGSSIFTFSPVSYPNPKIIDFGSSFGSLLAPIWPPGPLLELPVGTLGLKTSPFCKTP